MGSSATLYCDALTVMLQRLLPLLLIILVHIMLLQFLNVDRFIQTSTITVVPVMLYETPVTQFTVVPAPQPIPQKKIQPLPNITSAPILPQSPNPFPEPAASSTIAAKAPAVADEEVVPKVEIPAQPENVLLTLPPPNASYLLDVIRTEPTINTPYYGSGEIHWKHDGNSYTMQIEVGINLLFANIHLYRLQSEGAISNTGIKPRSVTETRRGKSAVTTHFNDDNNAISFSDRMETVPLLEGAQDKATVLMQLASIGNANPAQFQQGKEFTIQVAEENAAPPYQFVVLNQETLDTKLGHFVTWHIVRPPHPGFYSSQLDIWIAPELHWLPIQIRHTESNGAITTQTIRKIISEADQ